MAFHIQPLGSSQHINDKVITEEELRPKRWIVQSHRALSPGGCEIPSVQPDTPTHRKQIVSKQTTLFPSQSKILPIGWDMILPLKSQLFLGWLWKVSLCIDQGELQTITKIPPKSQWLNKTEVYFFVSFFISAGSPLARYSCVTPTWIPRNIGEHLEYLANSHYNYHQGYFSSSPGTW